MRRRELLVAAAAALACRRDPASTTGLTGLTGDTGGAATLLRVAPFVGERDRELETMTGRGLDARWVLDLTQLQEEALVLPQEQLFVRTEAPLGLQERIDAGWNIELSGEVSSVSSVGVDELLTLTQDFGAVHVECSGNTDFGGFGLQGAVAWGGVPLAQVLSRVTPTGTGALIRIRGFDEHPPPMGSSRPGASWVFRPDELDQAFLATHAAGEPLTPDHGAPVRLMVPGWYGCTCIKWVDQIAWVPADEPATSQMQEFASRTMQDGVPALASGFAPAVIDVAATPVRVEVWDVDGQTVVRVVGIVWGGLGVPEGLRLWANGADVGLVGLLDRASHRTWGWWTAELPRRFSQGEVRLHLTVDDAGGAHPPARRRVLRAHRLDLIHVQHARPGDVAVGADGPATQRVPPRADCARAQPRGLLAAEPGGDGLSRGPGARHPEAAQPGHPPQAGHLWVGTQHGSPIRGEGAQPGPARVEVGVRQGGKPTIELGRSQRTVFRQDRPPRVGPVGGRIHRLVAPRHQPAAGLGARVYAHVVDPHPRVVGPGHRMGTRL